MSEELASLQHELVHAVWITDPAAEGYTTSVRHIIGQPGFSIYRNTVLKAAVDALEQNFPAVAKIVGAEWFRSAAVVFARAHPPSSPILSLYGGHFATFLSDFPPAEEVPYISQVAMLDWLFAESLAAPDSQTLDPSALARLPAAVAARARLNLKPATRFLCLDTSAPSIWMEVRGFEPEVEELVFEARDEGVLIMRAASVQAVRMTSSGCRFLDAIAQGQTLECAGTSALECDPELDLAALLGTLLENGAFSSLVLSEGEK